MAIFNTSGGGTTGFKIETGIVIGPNTTSLVIPTKLKKIKYIVIYLSSSNGLYGYTLIDIVKPFRDRRYDINDSDGTAYEMNSTNDSSAIGVNPIAYTIENEQVTFNISSYSNGTYSYILVGE